MKPLLHSTKYFQHPAHAPATRLIIRSLVVLLFIFTLSPRTFAQPPGGVIFQDDFNRATLGSNWTTPTGTHWSIVNNAAYNNTEGPGDYLRTTTGYSQSSFILETAAKGFTADYFRAFHITFGQKNLARDSAYAVTYSPYTTGKITLERITGNIFAPAAILDEFYIDPDFTSTAYYTFKIARYASGLIQVYINTGAGYSTLPVLEAIDTTYPAMGHVGWQADSETTPKDFFVDNIHVIRPATEKPAVREKPAQDNLISQIIVTSNKPYAIAKLTTGAKLYTDRTYTITSVPAHLQGTSFIQTANDDKSNTASNLLRVYSNKNLVAFAGYDPRATTLPAWLAGWTKTTDHIGTTDPGSSVLDVYSKTISASALPLVLGGNLQSPAAGSQMNYLVAVIAQPAVVRYEAELAALSGAVIANNQPGYSGTGFADYIHASNDYVEWTINIPVPGYYTFVFGVSNGATTQRSVQIATDGLAHAALNVPPGGSWQTWMTSGIPEKFLTAGTHTVRASTTGVHGPNIDYLSVIPTEGPSARTGYTSAPVADAAETPVSVETIPNPFSGQATIRYTLLQPSPTRLQVFDAAGKRVTILVDETQPAGTYSVIFEPASLPGGLYIYRLESGATRRWGKMIFQR